MSEQKWGSESLDRPLSSDTFDAICKAITAEMHDGCGYGPTKREDGSTFMLLPQGSAYGGNSYLATYHAEDSPLIIDFEIEALSDEDLYFEGPVTISKSIREVPQPLPTGLFSKETPAEEKVDLWKGVVAGVNHELDSRRMQHELGMGELTESDGQMLLALLRNEPLL